MSMFPIASGSPSGSNITFTNIPQTFTHLQVRIMCRSGRAVAGEGLWLAYNNVFTATYFYHNINGNGSTANCSSGTGDVVGRIGIMPGASSLATAFGVAIVDILDYTNTNKTKTYRSYWGADDNNVSGTNLFTGLYSGSSSATTAITRLDIGLIGDNMVSGSRIDLYGISTSFATGV